MASSLSTISEIAGLNALLGGVPLAIVAPIKVALTTTVSSASSAGTEVPTAGGSYTRQAVTFPKATTNAVSNMADVTFAGMPAVTVVGVAIYDSSPTPQYLAWGSLTAARVTNAGDTLVLPAGQLTITLV